MYIIFFVNVLQGLQHKTLNGHNAIIGVPE